MIWLDAVMVAPGLAISCTTLTEEVDWHPFIGFVVVTVYIPPIEVVVF
jgi:hypothetical protein